MIERVELGVSEDYWHNWDEKKAICEVISNAFDNSISGDIEIQKSGRRLTVINDKVLPSECLFLGKSYSRDNSDAIGMFGEGLKACALVLLRNDESMIVRTGDKKIKPEFVNKTLDGKTIRTFSWVIEDGQTYFDKTIIDVTTDIPIYEFRDEYLKLSEKKLDYLVESDYGDMFDQKKKSRLYVKGKLIKNLEAYDGLFSYNLFTNSINRDRDIVDIWDLKYSIAEILSKAETEETIKRILAALVSFNSLEAQSFRGFDKRNHEMVLKCWKDLYGKNSVISTSSESETIAKHKGYRTITVMNSRVVSGLQETGIKTDEDVANKSDYYEWDDPTESEKELIDNVYELFKLSKHVRECTKPNFRIFVDSSISSRGVCIRNERIIGFKRSEMINISDVVSIMGHELTHYVFDTSDNSDEHDLYERKIFTDVMLELGGKSYFN